MVTAIVGMYSSDGNIIVKLPVQPSNDLFLKMSSNHKQILKKQLLGFKEVLVSANTSTNNQKTMACMRLRSVFGGDFPKS